MKEVRGMIELGSRRLVHFGVNRNPTDGWAAQQLREATPFGDGLCHTPAVCFQFWTPVACRVAPTGLLLSE